MSLLICWLSRLLVEPKKNNNKNKPLFRPLFCRGQLFTLTCSCTTHMLKWQRVHSLTWPPPPSIKIHAAASVLKNSVPKQRKQPVVLMPFDHPVEPSEVPLPRLGVAALCYYNKHILFFSLSPISPPRFLSFRFKDWAFFLFFFEKE